MLTDCFHPSHLQISRFFFLPLFHFQSVVFYSFFESVIIDKFCLHIWTVFCLLRKGFQLFWTFSSGIFISVSNLSVNDFVGFSIIPFPTQTFYSLKRQEFLLCSDSPILQFFESINLFGLVYFFPRNPFCFLSGIKIPI